MVEESIKDFGPTFEGSDKKQDPSYLERRKTSAEQISEVIPARWEQDTLEYPVPTSSVDTFGAIQEPRRVSVTKKPQDASVEDDIPGVDLSHLSPAEREQILADASEVRDGAHSRNDSRAEDRRDDFDFTYSDVRFSEISDENFDQERYKVSVRSDSGVVDAVEISDDLYKQEESDWAMGRTRMWTTVFEGDESEQPSDEVFNRQSPGERVYGSVSQKFLRKPEKKGNEKAKNAAERILHKEHDQASSLDDDYALKEIEFDTGLGTSKSLTSAKMSSTPWTPMGLDAESVTPLKRPTPEITVTVHDERDSEEEESGSED
ncbi:unnamed protein product, partial [Strongylus vulgaris]